MRGRERRCARHELGIDRRADKLGELHQLGMRAAVRDRITGHDHRSLRPSQKIRRRLDRGLVAAQPRCHPRGRHEIDVGIGTQDVAGQREEHRPGGRRQRGLGGTVHQTRQIGEAMHLRRPLDQRTGDGGKVGPQDRLGGDEALLVLTGGEEDRRARLLRVVQHAHGVAQAGRDVEIDRRELARGLRVAVGHRHDRGLLQSEQVAKLVLGRECIHQRQLCGARIAEQDLDAFLLEQIEEGALSGHDGQEVLQMLGLLPIARRAGEEGGAWPGGRAATTTGIGGTAGDEYDRKGRRSRSPAPVIPDVVAATPRGA